MECYLTGRWFRAVYHKVQYWDPYCFLFSLTIWIVTLPIGSWNLLTIQKYLYLIPVCNQSDYMKFQEDLNRLFSWSTDWQMLFNVEKCIIMHIRRSNKVYNYSLDGSILKEVAVEKDLGVMISKDLKVSHQCSSAYSKANKILGIINRTIVHTMSKIKNL